MTQDASLLADDRQRFESAIAAIDRANGQDPNQIATDQGPVAKELLYARAMTAWLERLYPNASTALQLAVRCQHIERWHRPRDDYPAGRVGYLSWRENLKRYHAERAGEILAPLGYNHETVARVQSLIKKQRLKSDPEAQALEDVVCLVFLETELDDFARRHDSAKVVTILQKTWRKMSSHGQAAALALDHSQDAEELLSKALGIPGEIA